MIDILIPTRDRAATLAITLTCIALQEGVRCRILVADQGEAAADASPEVIAASRFVRLHGHDITFIRNMPPRGLAHQRQLLLEQSSAPQILYLDDDVMLEPWLVRTLNTALTTAGCGFVGSALIGLGYEHDVRPHEQAIEWWEDGVQPETLEPGGAAWTRHRLHNAANLLHVQRSVGCSPGAWRLYKVAWVGGCVMFDRAKLLECGGYDFWRSLPTRHAGEDVEAQRRVMARYGGAGLLPSGAYHQEVPTTLLDRSCDAPHYLREAVVGGGT